jgi:transposase
MSAVGIDISKYWIDIALGGKVWRVRRDKESLVQLFDGLPKDSRIVLEATGRFHRLVVDLARRAGLEVRVVDPYVFSLYRASLNPRAKTDPMDALALMRFAEKEWDRLLDSPVCSKEIQLLKDLLEARETQVKFKTAFGQSLREMETQLPASQKALKAIEASIKDLDERITRIARKDPLYSVFLEMNGVGPATAPALVWLFRAHSFETSDQVVAFVGMDVRVKESGKFVGKRKLTKRGPAFIRRLAYLVANSLRRTKDFQPLFKRHHDKGLRTNAVNMIVARKLLRVAHYLATTGARYDRAKLLRT